MKQILLFDTSIGSENLGDKIIMKYCNKELNDIFADDFLYNVPTHDYIGENFKKLYELCDTKIVCGTNLLSTHRKGEFIQWLLDKDDYKRLKDVILMGVGWRVYQSEIDAYTKKLYRKILSSDKLLSVRDSYTENKLKEIGIQNVINTGCPTMWQLNKDKCALIPKNKSRDVVTTITSYNIDKEADKVLINTLKKNYNKVYIWLQSHYDLEYLKELDVLDNVVIIPPKLEEFERILELDVDYVGTRLHAGIHSLNNEKRTIIVEIDNRAKEIRKDTNIVTISRNSDVDILEDIIWKKIDFDIRIPENNINIWKKQFRE